MNDLATSEKIQQLDQRHTQLIDELDALNERLEQVLKLTSAGQDSPTC